MVESKPNLIPGKEQKGGALELKRRFPSLQIRIYDAATKTRNVVRTIGA
jgi:hypothetical protein